MSRIFRNAYNLAMIVSGLLFFSCTEDIDFDLNQMDEQVLVVEGYVTNERKVHSLLLTLSDQFYGEDALLPAEGASVMVSDGTNDFIFTETEPGLYQSDPGFAGKVGYTYTLTIDYTGKLYHSSSTLDSVPPIDSLTLVANPYYQSGGKTNYFLFAAMTEIPGKGNHYLWKVYKNDRSRSESLGSFRMLTDDLADGQHWSEIPLKFGISVGPEDTIRVEQYSISKESYEIYNAAEDESVDRNGLGLFDAPPANVPSNISNGALGLWDARAVTEQQIYLSE